MTRQRMKAPQRRRQIMAVAQRLFAQQGYSLTTTAAIAAQAGVTEPILYRHFRGKRELFLELLEEISESAIAHLRSIAGRSADPIEQLGHLIAGYPRVSEQFNEPFAMIDRALASLSGGGRGGRKAPDVRPLLAGHYHAYETLLADIVRRGQKSGQLNADLNARLAAWHLIHTALGWRLTHHLAPQVFARKDFVPQSARLLLAGLIRKK